MFLVSLDSGNCDCKGQTFVSKPDSSQQKKDFSYKYRYTHSKRFCSISFAPVPISVRLLKHFVLACGKTNIERYFLQFLQSCGHFYSSESNLGNFWKIWLVPSILAILLFFCWTFIRGQQTQIININLWIQIKQDMCHQWSTRPDPQSCQ